MLSAERQGIGLISHLDGEAMAGLTLNDAVEKMRGLVGTDVKLTIRREGKAPFDVSLTRAVRRGQLERVGRGLYGLPGREVSAHGSLAEVARRVPKGVVCLLSALRFHGLTTQAPFEVWLAIENKSLAPKLDFPPLRIVRFSGAALTEGVEEQVVDGVTIRITCVAKTVADCFKYRNKIGLDVALETLRKAWHEKRMTSDDI